MNKENELFEVQFKADRRGLFHNSSASEIERDDYVIVEADRGQDIGFVSQKGSLVKLKYDKKDSKSLKKIIRPATEEDVEKMEQRNAKEKEALEACKKKVVEHNLPMKLVDVEIQFDHSKITFYFTADQRIDFRELVRELASIYRTRIELRQIGVRDEARRLGGFGICGLKQCCNSFIREFEQIATHMARDQKLMLNPSKISGNCGRLLCCLRYELEYYHEMAKKCPDHGCKVKTEKGTGTVMQNNIFKKTVLVKYDSGEEVQTACSACTLLSGKPCKPVNQKQEESE